MTKRNVNIKTCHGCGPGFLREGERGWAAGGQDIRGSQAQLADGGLHFFTKTYF